MTAVETLFRIYMDNNRSLKLSDFENALQMERKQIEQAAIWIPEEFGSEFIPQLGTRYYEETYGEQKKSVTKQ